MIYITGDIHGDFISRFNPADYTSYDTIIIAGDCGIPWNEHTTDHTFTQIKYASNMPCPIIFLGGNHDNYDAIQEMPPMQKWSGIVRKWSYKGYEPGNVFYVDTPQVLTIENHTFMLIPGGKSHDIDVVLDPHDPEYFAKQVQCIVSRTHYRTIGVSYWPQEEIDTKAAQLLLDSHPKVDCVVSHEGPAFFVNKFKHYMRLSDPEFSDGEKFLDKLYSLLGFKIWFFGHYHLNNIHYKDNLICIFQDIWEWSELL